MAPTSKNSWKLEESIARESQGFIATGYGDLKHGRALFVQLPAQSNGKWLDRLQQDFPITPAIAVGGGARERQAISIAFTWSGLHRMGLQDNALASFSTPFREGMFEESRLRRLGDRRSGVWQDTVIQDGPRWSGNTPSQRTTPRGGAYSVPITPPPTAGSETDAPRETPLSVHAMVLVYAQDAAAVQQIASQIETALKPHKIKIVHALPLETDGGGTGPAKEHFGFADGLSQPQPFDKYGRVRRDGQDVTDPDRIHGTPLGEFLMGYENGHQEVAPGPVVPGDTDAALGDRPATAGLPAHPDARGFYDIGKNGSYLVVRELYQDVAGFWRSMQEAAKVIRDHDPEAAHITADWVAQKAVGRTRGGHVLRPEGSLAPGADGKPASDFEYFDADRFGFGCPLGSHVRRANPRDSLAPGEGAKKTLLNAARNHRILRRARNYGPKIDDPNKDDGKDRGLLFMCLNTDIARQFEFIQQTWLFNKDFSTLFEEVDPLVGADGWMTVPEDPLRRRLQLKTFIRLVGGEYFFMPSLATIRYLALL